MAKPVVRCEEGSLSPTKARNGSIDILIDASNTQSSMAAIHNAYEFGIKNKAKDARIAPAKKNGRLLPQNGCQVLSLIYPMIGCTTNPVKGAAIQSIAILSKSAPK